MDKLETVLGRTIYMTRHGSQAYGTNIEGSDTDWKGVCVPSSDYFLGFNKRFEQLEQKSGNGDPFDTVIMSLHKFANLAADSNPNIIEILNTSTEDIFYCDWFGERLREAAPLFLSSKARFTFAGYAHSQLLRIKNHRKWLLNPPKVQPTRKEFGLSETSKISKSEMGAFEHMGEVIEVSKELLTILTREKQYAAAKNSWDKYNHWVKTRNPERAKMEAQAGYDCKHAMHLVRLMRMCKEILAEGKVIVRRPDYEELLEIRSGKWSYDKVVDHAEDLQAECEKLYQTTKLPKHADRDKLDKLVIELTEKYLSKYG